MLRIEGGKHTSTAQCSLEVNTALSLQNSLLMRKHKGSISVYARVYVVIRSGVG